MSRTDTAARSTTATTPTPTKRFHRPRWTLIGIGLILGSAALTWAVARAWVVLVLVLVLGGFVWIGRVRVPSSPDAASDPGWSAASCSVATRSAVATALRRDLPRLAARTHGLSIGGSTDAGLLAEQIYVATDTLALMLIADSNTTPEFIETTTKERVSARKLVASELREVRRRISRLNSAVRPDGLDHIDGHLAELALLTEDYVVSTEGLPDDGNDVLSSGPIARHHRDRARIVAWVAVNCGIDLPHALAGQQRRTRIWIRLWSYRRARYRMVRLWGRGNEGHRDGSVSSRRKRPEDVMLRRVAP